MSKRTLSLRPLPVVVLLAAAAATPVEAQNELVLNPEFDGALTGWTYVNVPPQLGSDADDCPDSDSWRVDSPSGTSMGAVAEDCVEVSQGDILHLEVTYRSDAKFDLRLIPYQDTNCAVALTSTIGMLPYSESAEWTKFRVQRSIDLGTIHSVRLWFRADDDVAYTVELDRAYLGFEERVFADDFDGGTFCRWDLIHNNDQM